LFVAEDSRWDRRTHTEIQGFLLESYAVEVSAEFISSVTDAVMEEVGAWCVFRSS
jgi:transposase-like protein